LIGVVGVLELGFTVRVDLDVVEQEGRGWEVGRGGLGEV
jgi:hypothetical protein